MSTDAELLQRYKREGAEEAFRELARRHVDLVYGTALRQLCGHAALAEDVTQAVFSALAAQAGAGREIRHLPAWLYTTTRYTVSHAVRAERRRQIREQEAQAMHAALGDPADDPPLDIPSGVIDEALERLDEVDREAVLLRYFEAQPFSAVAARLDIREDAARMRVGRALEKMRAQFARRGITSTAAAVGGVLAQQAVAAPSGLATAAATTALAGAAALGGAASAGTLGFMTTTKITVSVAAVAVALTTGYGVMQQRSADQLALEAQRAHEARHQAEQRADALQRQVAALNARPTQAERAPAAQPARPAAVPAPVQRASGRVVADAPQRAKEKMAALRPQLAAGMPIKGTLVASVEGKPVSVSVGLVMGRATRVEFEGGDVYVINPALNEDGSVRFQLSLVRKRSDGQGEETEGMPAVTNYPWGEFIVSSPKAILAFVPDLKEPE